MPGLGRSADSRCTSSLYKCIVDSILPRLGGDLGWSPRYINLGLIALVALIAFLPVRANWLFDVAIPVDGMRNLLALPKRRLDLPIVSIYPKLNS